MVKTLVEPKKTVISSLRARLLSIGFQEEVEYDPINIEPVLIYSRLQDEQSVLVKHKWELIALVPMQTEKQRNFAQNSSQPLSEFDYEDEEGNLWLKFQLPKDEEFLVNLFGS